MSGKVNFLLRPVRCITVMAKDRAARQAHILRHHSLLLYPALSEGKELAGIYAGNDGCMSAAF